MHICLCLYLLNKNKYKLNSLNTFYLCICKLLTIHKIKNKLITIKINKFEKQKKKRFFIWNTYSNACTTSHLNTHSVFAAITPLWVPESRQNSLVICFALICSMPPCADALVFQCAHFALFTRSTGTCRRWLRNFRS